MGRRGGAGCGTRSGFDVERLDGKQVPNTIEMEEDASGVGEKGTPGRVKLGDMAMQLPAIIEWMEGGTIREQCENGKWQALEFPQWALIMIWARPFERP